MPAARLTRQLGTETPNDWVHHAACHGTDITIFFPTGQGDRSSHARTICAQCPVTTQCLNDALAAGPDLCGIWAGTSQKQRRAILRGQPEPAEDKPRRTCYTAPTPTDGISIKQQAIDLYHQARHLYRSDASCYRAVGQQLGINHDTVGDWVYRERKGIR